MLVGSYFGASLPHDIDPPKSYACIGLQNGFELEFPNFDLPALPES